MADTQQPADPVGQYIATLLDAAKLDALPDGAREQMEIALRDQVQRRIGVLAVRELDADGLDAMRVFLERETPPEQKELEEFFASRIPDFAQKLERELDIFAQEFVTAALAA
ncbi:MAG: hypothetical protein Q7T01_03755 [bacterium]|nr:hypothetical protein [bacterium]